ncbi:uncharacterized protein LAJ45_08428 [Morchella importuna]|uniref:uncharacterized protein n=1 Tax=Morchella importuna TaxID=1174673 RepID=UPI001E8D7839|nr:uncharacterized protein LAJ45_08428 [Morchella importuna]KAH8147600.1 hypothetical protein LAJ45_08428 [Morchella importuna]
MIDRAQTPSYSTPPSTPEPTSIIDSYSVGRNRLRSQTTKGIKAVVQHNNTTAYYQPSYGRNRPQRTIPPPGYITVCLEPNAHHVNATPNPSENRKVRKAQTQTQSTVTTAYYQPSYGRNRPERIIPPPVYTDTAGPTSTRQLQKPKLAISNASNTFIAGADMRPQVRNAYYQPSYGRNRPERTVMPLTQGNNTGNIGLFSNTLRTGTRPPSRDGPLSVHSSSSKDLLSPVGFGPSPYSTDGPMHSKDITPPPGDEESLESQIAPTSSLIPISAQESVTALSPTPMWALNQMPTRGRAQALAPGLAITADPPTKLRAYKRALAGVVGRSSVVKC